MATENLLCEHCTAQGGCSMRPHGLDEYCGYYDPKPETEHQVQPAQRGARPPHDFD